MVRYVIERIFAEGAQGRLYRAQDKITNQVCILKTGDSVKKEALLALELNHPYIARPFDFGVDPEIGTYAAYPEYTDPSLLEWIEKKPKENDLRRVAVQIAEFLAFIHHRGWLYNDFKPGHFLISEKDIRVLDLGLCSRIEESSGTFSGTFPYIAPERLAGRPSDVRSDIFAFGMLLLHTLVPNENWNYEPSIAVLQELQKRTEHLPRYWKELLSEMISLEASQRIESAVELWNRLLPSSQGNFLFFPFPPCFPIETSAFNERAVAVQSNSNIGLKEIENRSTQSAWNNGTTVISFDLRRNSLEDCFDSLCRVYADKLASDVLMSVDSLCNTNLRRDLLLVFRKAESLSSQQKPIFSYAISALRNNPRVKFIILTNKPFSVEADLCKRIVLPPLTKQNIDQLLPEILPSNRNGLLDKLVARNFSLPEQLLVEFRKNLSGDQYDIWPVAAKDSFEPANLDGLRPIEMRALGCLAVSGCTLGETTLFSALRIGESQGTRMMDSLESSGYVQLQQGEGYFLVVPDTSILTRLRKDRTRHIAESLLKVWPKGHDVQTLYRIARFAKKKRIAAFIALTVAREQLHEGKFENAHNWFWASFSLGAKLPKTVIYMLMRYSLLRVQSNRILKLSTYVRTKFGRSFRLLEIQLDLFYRTNRFKDGISLSKTGINRALKRGNQFSHDYFTARLGGFLILDYRLDEGEAILHELLAKKSPELTEPRILGLANHFLGLSSIYRGKFDDALKHSRLAAASPHHYRASSIMNLGASFIRIGKPDRAERLLRKAAKIFSSQKDVDRLCFCYTNLGIAIKQAGRVMEARNYYVRALQFSSICKNVNVKLHILANLAITYELEGRTTRAIRYHAKAAKLAKKHGFRVQLGIALINAAAQYSILGKYKSAIGRLTNAVKIVRGLNLQFEVASAYESFGFAYLLSKHYRKAVESFGQAISSYSKAGADKDEKRARILLAISMAEDGNYEKIKELLNSSLDLNHDSFEDGMFKYALGYYALRSDDSSVQCRDWIHQSEAIFRKIPSLFWLGRLQKLKAEYLLKTDHFEKANISLQSAYNIFSRLGAKKELMNLSKGRTITGMPEDFVNRMAERLPYKILLMIKEVLSEPDPDKMITKILSASLEFTDMERAVLILNEDPPKIFKSALLDESAVREIYDISNSAMDEATDTRKPYVRLDAVSDPYLKSKPSILASRIMSIVCLPLRANDKPIGVLYLDSREGVETLASTETVLLEIFASIISLALNNSLILERSLAENEGLRSSLGLMQFPEIIGKSEVMMKVLKTVTQLLPTELPVLITGETGTGKEMIARVLHFSGKRKNGAFLAVNCSAFSKDLLESELFGHEKGSFTGAIAQKKGLFEQARGGTLFLDEIGDMPYPMQAKLLRVLQEGEFRRVGGNETLHTDVRLVLATNRNLPEMVKQERFREDLFYRIKGAQVHLPPLRERSQDIQLLVLNFLGAANTGTDKKVTGFAPETLELLKKYAWPGNIRQLKNEVERVVALTQNEWIQPEDLDEEIRETKPSGIIQKGTLREREKQIITESLEEHKWNIVQTAKTLGLTRNGLYGKMKLHGIPRKSVE